MEKFQTPPVFQPDQSACFEREEGGATVTLFLMCDTDIQSTEPLGRLSLESPLKFLPLSSVDRSGKELEFRKTESAKERWNWANETSAIVRRQTAFSRFSPKENPHIRVSLSPFS